MYHIFIFWATYTIGVKAVPIHHGDIQSKAYQMNEDYFTDEKLTPESHRSSLPEFQKYNLFRRYGKLSADILQAIKSPRCGLPIIPVASKVKWTKFDMNWCLMTPSRKLPVCEQRKTLALAFRIWSQGTIFKFSEVSCDNADIRFYFSWSYPGNGYRFDGQGSRQVYVSMAESKRGNPQKADIYFDDEEPWQTQNTQKASLLFAAAHAIGHALGLGHSSDPQSVMIFSFYYPVAVLSTTDRIALQELYGDSAVVKMPKQEETTEVSATKKSALYGAQTLILEPSQEPFDNIKTKQENNLVIDNQISSPTSLGYEASVTPTSANYKDIRRTVCSDPKTESVEQVERDSKKLPIPKPKISAEAEKDAKSGFMKKLTEEDSVTNGLDKELSQKEMVSSLSSLSKQKPESKTEVTRPSYPNDGLKQHQLLKSDSNVKLKGSISYLTSELPGRRPRDNEEMAGDQPNMIPNSKNETIVDLSNRKMLGTIAESSGKEFAEMVTLRTGQDKQQTPRSQTVEKLEKKENKDIFKWPQADRMPRRGLVTQRMSATSQEPEFKMFEPKHIGKTKDGSTDIPKHEGDTDINLRTEETKDKKNNEKIFFLKSGPKPTEMVKRPDGYQESTSQRKSALAENVRLEKLRTTLRITNIEMLSLKLNNHSRKLPESEKAVLKDSKTSPSEEKTGVTELRRKEQKDNAGGTFIAGQEALTTETNTQWNRENEKYAQTLQPEEITTQSGYIKTSLALNQTDGPTSEIVPTEIKNSSRLIHTKLSLVKNSSIEISLKRRSRTVRRKLNGNTSWMIRKNVTLLEINATILKTVNLKERLSPTNSLSGNHNTSSIDPRDKITSKRPCQCNTKIANCQSLFCKFLEKVFQACCYLYMHICALFSGAWLNNFKSIS